MKVFKKVFAFAIALTAIAMASSAMAADATYDNGVVKVANAGLTSELQTTVAVVDTQFGKTDAAPSADDIYYIDQDTAANINSKLATGVTLKTVADFTPSTAEVRVGGNGKTSYDTYTIPNVVYNEGYKTQEPAERGEADGEPAGTKRLGFEGTFKLNGGAVSKIKFKLISAGHDEALYNSEAQFDNTNELVNFIGELPSIVGEVSFGLEVAGVPEGVTVTLDAVTVE